jgi:hypothetical protein
MAEKIDDRNVEISECGLHGLHKTRIYNYIGKNLKWIERKFLILSGIGASASLNFFGLLGHDGYEVSTIGRLFGSFLSGGIIWKKSRVMLPTFWRKYWRTSTK